VHSAGVAATAVSLAEELHFSPRELHLMKAAGYLHDLGKLGVPGRILDKPGKLTSEEYLRVKTHTYFTYRILETIGGMQQIAEWAAFHHERLDGKGYPFRLSGDELTLGSRIMAVADVFTALLEDRPYRKGMSLEEALAIINRLVRDGALDGEVVKTLNQQCERIDHIRRSEQVEYGAQQAILFNLTGREARAEEPALLAAVG
jgi:HD-GYP domain-containing protein (c-di-GMP phosphodiesterase class II)